MILRLAAVLALIAAPAGADVALGDGGKLKVSGDMRMRVESDWDSMQSNGSKREDRDRLRSRLRLGFTYDYDGQFSFGGRARTGAAADQQSPHQTAGDEFDAKGVNVDKAYVRGVHGPAWAWAGKNSFPFWTQNELFWDEDVTPEGFSAGYAFPPVLGVKVKPTVGYFVIEGSGSSNRFKDKANLTAAQLAFEGSAPFADLTAAGGLFAFKDNALTVDAALADLDYNIWVFNAKAGVKGLPKPLAVGLDWMHNARAYSPGFYNRDQRDGFVAGALYGGLKVKGDWLAGYYFARIEKYAVVARFAQDDWLRWGGATDTRSSNFIGHEVRLAYALGPSFNVVSRLFLIDGLRPEAAGSVAKEDGNRLRVDLNIGF